MLSRDEVPAVHMDDIAGYILLRCLEDGIDIDLETIKTIFRYEIDFMEEHGIIEPMDDEEEGERDG